MPDIMFIGPATKDVNIDYNGKTVYETGGAVYFGAYSARSSGADVCIAVKLNSDDKEVIKDFRFSDEKIYIMESTFTTLMKNTYFTVDRERRKSECMAHSDPITINEIPDIPVKMYHLAGLLYGDFSLELIKYLKKKAVLSADIQGFLRHNKNGVMELQDLKEKEEYLSYFDFLKTDTVEAEILTGTDDRMKAAEIMYSMGASEILISNNEEMLAFDGKKFSIYPVKSRNMSGRTGRGDTVFASYISRRLKNDSMDSALAFATAAVSLKMENPGPLDTKIENIKKYMKEFY